MGYAPTGAPSTRNDLYRSELGGRLSEDQNGTILGEYRRFLMEGNVYPGSRQPDCMALPFLELWSAHTSNRLDPKYFLFKREERDTVPHGWVRVPLGDVMKRREDIVDPTSTPEKAVTVMTLGQNGEIRVREAGKGRNPPEWLGMYFEEIPSQWYSAKSGDVVYSSIDLWKGCIAVVPQEFDGALVTKEFPIFLRWSILASIRSFYPSCSGSVITNGPFVR